MGCRLRSRRDQRPGQRNRVRRAHHRGPVRVRCGAGRRRSPKPQPGVSRRRRVRARGCPIAEAPNARAARRGILRLALSCRSRAEDPADLAACLRMTPRPMRGRRVRLCRCSRRRRPRRRSRRIFGTSSGAWRSSLASRISAACGRPRARSMALSATADAVLEQATAYLFRKAREAGVEAARGIGRARLFRHRHGQARRVRAQLFERHRLVVL